MSEGLDKYDWGMLDKLLEKATRNQLDEIQNRVEKEIRLSETAIKEGFENDTPT